MKKTALIVVDMVKAFFDPKGSSYYQESSDVLENVSLLMKVARQNKLFIVHSVERHFANIVDDEQKKIPIHCIMNTLDCEYVPGAEPISSNFEIELPKRRYSAFMATDLDLVLRAQGIQRVVIVGVKTNVCIRATAQDGFALGYEVVVPLGCTNSNRAHLAQASYEDIQRYIGSTPTINEAVTLLEGLVNDAQ